MEILTLHTENFKGVPLDINFEGVDTDIYGDNGTGKTTVADAIWWLLFNKNSLNETVFEIKPLDAYGQPRHNLEYAVEATFRLDNNEIVTLKKVLTEKWTQKRGSAVKENTGNETKYFIDGTPKPTNKFNAYIKETFISEDIFKLLTNVHHFSENIDWKARRELVLKICGDVESADIFAANPDIKELENLFANKSLEDFKATINAEKKKINDELKIIPAKIAELKNNIDVEPSESKLKLEAALGCVRKELNTTKEEILLAKNGSTVINLKKAIAEVDTAILTRKNDLNKDITDRITALSKEISEQQLQESSIRQEQSLADSRKLANEEEIANIENDLKALADKFDTEAAEKYPDTPIDDTCALCGQKLPADQINLAREKEDKARTDYNIKKAKRLEDMNAQGKQLKANLDKDRADIIVNENKAAELGKTAADIRQIMEDKRKEYRAMLDNKIDSSPAIDALEARKLKYLQQITDVETAAEVNITGLKENAAAKQTEIDNLENKLAVIRTSERTQERIAELTKQQKDYAQRFEELSRQLFLTEEFTKTRVKLLEDKVSSKFKLTQFKMFTDQINGGISECCEPMHDGKPYKALNNAMQYNIGLDIIRTLDAHYNFYPPIFIDNAESITKLNTDIDAQIIRLIVSEPDKKLRVVVKDETRKEIA
ncbi:AAA family ATPase [Pectinatus haikarae]|uniref:Nuclease SbcCD subunit C n=1 Tax=Pectinatus haikarae TaxID=349096 RepID=A0ABT9Y8C7_9FIRM|nr:AAA family ATPase [Pectinatus haikarae]MDQ0204094.1 DNA repair exonuclease SbcCD ATPase subunit [Pectinatus haikarae]